MAVLPSRLKRLIGNSLLGWDIHPTAHIGLSLVLVRRVTMGPGAVIGPFNVIRHLEELHLDEGAGMGSRNLIIGIPLGSPALPHSPNRDPSLRMGKYSMLTVQHSIDCADRVEIGDYSAVAGFRCTVLTHSVNLVRDRFETGPVVVGHHAGIMTGVTLLSGTTVPSRCIVSAGAVVNTRLAQELTVYSGNPAVAVRSLPATLGYFHRGEPGRSHLPG
jgi:acetyltransferase-like isoleucine patch superfamily enzyme